VEVTEAALVNPSFYIVRREDGSLDISDLAATPDEDGEQGAADKPVEPADAKSDWQVEVARFSVEGGRLRFEDRMETPPRIYEIDGFTARISGVGSNAPVDFELFARLPNLGGATLELDGNASKSSQEIEAKLALEGLVLTALNPWMSEELKFAGGKAALHAEVDAKKGEQAAVKADLTATGLKLTGPGGAGQAADLSLVADLLMDPDKEKVQINMVDLSAAGQKLHAEGVVACMVGVPCATVGITSEELLLDKILAILPPALPGSNGADGSGDKGGQASAKAPAKPIGEPGVDLDATVRIGRLVASGMELTNAKAHLEMKEGVIRIDPLVADLYGGDFFGRVRADLTKPGPPFAAKEELNGVDVGALLGVLVPEMKGTLTGTMEMTAVTDGVGNDLEAMKSQMSLSIGEGKLVGHPLAAEAARLFKSPELETINFYSINAEAKSAQGVAKLTRFYLDGKEIRVSATGKTGFMHKTLEGKAKAGVTREIAEKLIKEKHLLDELTDADGFTNVPLRFSGTLAKPVYGLDEKALTGVAADMVEDKATELLEEEVMDKLPDEVKEVVPGVMKKLFGK
jgi:uncharacterized protein involved in outer membrane biogenesis